MENKDVRWEQRFSNYRKALAKLEEIAAHKKLDSLSELEQEGLIQRFEYTYELAWNTLQDLLVSKGYDDIKGPNPVLRQALADAYILDEKGWRQMKKSRELTLHTYNSDTAGQIAEDVINVFYLLLKSLETRLDEERLGGRQQTIF